MKITPQDIIDKEFKVKFRGFDMAEVDTFLEEMAESFFKLTEENTLLNEKVTALRQDLEAAGSFATQAQGELPAELGSILEDLKHDTTTIGAELVALKQDRQAFDSLRANLEKAIASILETGAAITSQPQFEFPADFMDKMAAFKQGSEAVAGELAALKEERLALDSFKKDLLEAIRSGWDSASAKAGRPGEAAESGLSKIQHDFKQDSAAIQAELAALKQNVSAIAGIRNEIKGELKELLNAHFEMLEEKISQAPEPAVTAGTKPKITPPGKKDKLPAAKIVEEPEIPAEEGKLPDYRAEADPPSDGGLEFLSEDDILDVDKLRGVFQSVLDEDLSDSHDGRDDNDASADLLFLEDDFIGDEHEPEVTFNLDGSNNGNKPN